jgi:hypothetical protein
VEINKKPKIMKTIASKILAAAFCAFVALTLSTSIYAGNGTTAQPATIQTSGTAITIDQVNSYMESQGIKATSVTPANDGTSNIIVTTANGKKVVVYVNGDQFLGHDDLPQ